MPENERVEKIRKEVADRGIEFFFAQFVDLHARPSAKLIPAANLDDLVTDEAMRSKGLGKALLEWLSREAQRLGCGQVHLDSGLHRLDAHRFYERESFKKTAFHFAARLLRQKRTHTSLPKAGDHFSRIASASSQSFNLDGATREKVYNNATSGITGNAGSNTGASSSGQRTT